VLKLLISAELCICMYENKSDGPSWRVPTGRKDGRISLATEASNLPSPLDSVAVQKQKFQDKGLDTHDLVTLLGISIYLFYNRKLENF